MDLVVSSLPRQVISFLLDLQHYCAALFLPEYPKGLRKLSATDMMQELLNGNSLN